MTAKKTTAAKTETPDIPAEAPKTETPDVAPAEAPDVVAEIPKTETPDVAPAETPAPTDSAADTDADGDTDKEAEEEVVKRNFAKIRIAGFRGSFGNAFFDDNGVCEECDEATARELQKHFPKANVEVLS